MIKPKIVFIIAFVILLSSPGYIFSQENHDLRFNAGFSFIAEHYRYDRGFDVTWSSYWVTSFRLKKHEFILGMSYQPGTGYQQKATSPGPMAGYRFYLFKELTRINVFFNYAFIYTPEQEEEHPRTGTVYYKSNKIYNIFGCGFNVFADKKRRLGITGTMCYAITNKDDEIFFRGIAFTTGLTFKIPISKKKSITEIKT